MQVSTFQESVSPLISLKGVTKSYPTALTGAQKLSTFWSLMRGRAPHTLFNAIEDVSFEIQRGESMGLVGVNGAGKSTLMKIVAGVVRATQGTVETRGRVGALLELGAGFHPEYTGRDNIFLACALMGLSQREAHDRVPAILSFADIGEHIEQPIKHYSSGMVVRLGFAIATTMDPDILITDEVLAVGDESFQKKCTAWMEAYLAKGGTLLLCSHSMYHIQKLCAHAAWIHEGRVKLRGTAAEVTRQYLAWHEEKDHRHKTDIKPPDTFTESTYQVASMRLNGHDKGVPVSVPHGGELTVSGTLYSPDGRAPVVAVGVVRADGTPIFGTFSELKGFHLAPVQNGLFGYALRFTRLPLLPGHYVARSHAMDPEGMRLFDHVERKFEISGNSRQLGFCDLEHEWLAIHQGTAHP